MLYWGVATYVARQEAGSQCPQSAAGAGGGGPRRIKQSGGSSSSQVAGSSGAPTHQPHPSNIPATPWSIHTQTSLAFTVKDRLRIQT